MNLKNIISLVKSCDKYVQIIFLENTIFTLLSTSLKKIKEGQAVFTRRYKASQRFSFNTVSHFMFSLK